MTRNRSGHVITILIRRKSEENRSDNSDVVILKVCTHIVHKRSVTNCETSDTKES